MMTTREILTIQFGHYSNFIGTHWWNLQESCFSYASDHEPSEINHDVMYREGKNLKKQVTYTPRLLIVDLKGALGYLKKEGTLYESSKHNETQPLWDDNKVDVTNEETVVPTPFIKSLVNWKHGSLETSETTFSLEDEVNSWVDYLVARFHPRTLNVIKQYTHESTTSPFDVFTYGKNLWNTEQFSEDFSERIRTYVEECDHMQGFQVILDSVDGFAGLGASCIQHLKDEYGKSILSFPCMDSKKTEPSASDLIKVLNTALCWQHIGEYSSLFSPLCCKQTVLPTGDSRIFDHLTYNSELNYHSSALLATALDTLSLRYRRWEYQNVVLSDLCADLNTLGRKAVATSLSLPFPMTAEMDLIDVLDEFTGTLWTSLTPNCDITMDRNMQSIGLRGVPYDRLKRPFHQAAEQFSKPAYRCSDVHEMMMLYFSSNCHASPTHLSTITSALKTKAPYPDIFNNNITETGDIMGWPVGTDVKSVPVMAGLHNGRSLSTMYESLHNQVSRIRSINKFHAFTNSGLEDDEFKECLNHLLDCKENYED